MGNVVSHQANISGMDGAPPSMMGTSILWGKLALSIGNRSMAGSGKEAGMRPAGISVKTTCVRSSSERPEYSAPAVRCLFAVDYFWVNYGNEQGRSTGPAAQIATND